jgi:hypothetical protein
MNSPAKDNGRPNYAICSGNLPLVERRPELWMLALMVDRLEEPLRALRMQALECQDLGEARALLSFAGCTENAEEHYPVLDSTEWLLERIEEMKACAEDVAFCVNVGLQEALGPPGVESEPAGIEQFCANILQALNRLLDLEKQILGRRLHPNLQDNQFNFAGVSADVIGSHQQFVARMRHFLENEDGNSFEFTIHVNFDRLSAANDTVVAPSPEPPPVPAPPTKKGPTAVGGCLIMAAFMMAGLLLPFPVLFVMFLLAGGVWLLGKAA